MHNESQFSLLRQQRFLPFFITQFLGAFNDNAFKNALIILIAFQMPGAGNGESNMLVNISAALFILPFFLFSSTAGQIGDRYDKDLLFRRIKLAEVIIMLAATIGFYVHSVPLLMGVLFFMGAQSAVFGPVKFGYLPQHLHTGELVGGNGMVEMGTFLAILIGQIVGGHLMTLEMGWIWVSVLILFIAASGYLSARQIPFTPAVSPALKINWNILSQTLKTIGLVRRKRTVFLSVLGISWFWFLGSIYLVQLPNYTSSILGGDPGVYLLLLSMFSSGIGLGSVLCEKLSGHRVEIGLVPFGSIGLSVFGIDLYFSAPVSVTGDLIGIETFLQQAGGWRTLADIVLIGIFGGFYIVPLMAMVQHRTDSDILSRVIAGNNILNALFMVVSAMVAIVILGPMGLDINDLFMIVAVANVLVALYIYTLVPEFLMRFLVWIIIHLLYRIETVNLEKVPDRGAAVVVCNHISFIDALVVGGSLRRPTRFVMHYKIYQIPLLRFIFRTAGAIPIAGAHEDRVMLEKAFEMISGALENGELVCIFPEGGLTSDGEIQTFKKGIERVIQRNPVPVIPLAIRGLWGSFFSRKDGPSVMAIPRRLWSRIQLVAGDQVSPDHVTAASLQEKVMALRGNWR